MFGITRAPDFDRPGLVWFNVPAPLRLADLSGRLVVLDFWTFCCINCFHTHPTLRRIEEAFPVEVAVVGVHSPKFDHERDPHALAQAIARYDIRHPVIHDPELVLWDEYRVRAWPTLVLVAPDGYVIGQLAGEPHPDLLMQGISDMVSQMWKRGELMPEPMAPELAGSLGGRLRFPGKIKACPSLGQKLWAIADTGHHQVVVVDNNGHEVARYGSGAPGFDDGGTPSFHGPEGVACDEDNIWVADTRNHALRCIDRASGRVETVAGQGGRGVTLLDVQPAMDVALASPWDVERVGDSVVFANAGSHQIGAFDLKTRNVMPLAGSGIEDIADGEAGQAHLAQPSGLALSPSGERLYFVDSETSAVRCLHFGEAPRVETLVGAGLFDFGLINGKFAEARFQHPLGLAATDYRLYVADSYNSRIRVMDLSKGSVSDVGPLPCAEPAGVVVDGAARLLVSDTNNHRIMEVSLSTGECRTWFE